MPNMCTGGRDVNLGVAGVLVHNQVERLQLPEWQQQLLHLRSGRQVPWLESYWKLANLPYNLRQDLSQQQ